MDTLHDLSVILGRHTSVKLRTHFSLFLIIMMTMTFMCNMP